MPNCLWVCFFLPQNNINLFMRSKEDAIIKAVGNDFRSIESLF